MSASDGEVAMALSSFRFKLEALLSIIFRLEATDEVASFGNKEGNIGSKFFGYFWLWREAIDPALLCVVRVGELSVFILIVCGNCEPSLLSS